MQIGRYRLESLIGRGGMGEVYRAFDTTKQRVVAVKLLPRHLMTDDHFKARFRRESLVAAQLRDPHVIPIHDFGEVDGHLFIDMRLVEGVDLAAHLRLEGPMSPRRAVDIATQVADALDAAHAEGLVHRDVKPSNILISRSGSGGDFAYLVDFGIASSTSGPALTATGVTIGTPDYIAPERFLHGQEDHRADVYSLACVLYEMVTGHRPFPVQGAPAQMHAHLNTPPPRPSTDRPELTPAFDQVIARGMAKDPDQRYASAGELAVAARRALTTPTEARPPEPPVADRPTMRGTIAGPPTGIQETPPPPRRRRRPVILAGALTIAVIATAVVISATWRQSPQITSSGTPTVLKTVAVGRTPVAVAVTPDGSHAYVTDSRSGTVSVVDTTADTVTATIPDAPNPTAIVLTPDGNHAYVVNDTWVSVIDTRTNKVTGTITVTDPPYRLACTPDGRYVYLTNTGAGIVSVIDTKTNTVRDSIADGLNSNGVAVAPDGRYVYVTDVANDWVSVIDTSTNNLTRGFVHVGGEPNAVAVTPDSRYAYVTSYKSGEVSVIDRSTDGVVATIPGVPGPGGIAMTPDGRHAYVSNIDSGTVTVIDTSTNKITSTVRVGARPLLIAFTPDGRYAYVPNSDSNTVSIIKASP